MYIHVRKLIIVGIKIEKYSSNQYKDIDTLTKNKLTMFYQFPVRNVVHCSHLWGDNQCSHLYMTVFEIVSVHTFDKAVNVHTYGKPLMIMYLTVFTPLVRQ